MFVCVTNITAKSMKMKGAENRHLSEPQKAHHTEQFVTMVNYCGCMLHGRVSSLVNVIMKARKQEGRIQKY